jgi:hypothetical protein
MLYRVNSPVFGMYEERGVQVALICWLHDENSYRNPNQNQKNAFSLLFLRASPPRRQSRFMGERFRNIRVYCNTNINSNSSGWENYCVATERMQIANLVLKTSFSLKIFRLDEK